MTACIRKREGGVYWFEGCAGDTISKNIDEVIEKLKELEAEGQQVKGILTFNGLELNLLHNTDPALALVVWNSACDKRHEEYIASDSYKVQQEAAAKRLIVSQKNMDELVAQIRPLLSDWAAVNGGSGIQPNGDTALRLMALLKEYIEEADNIHINHYGPEIVVLLEAAGYKENEYTGGNKPVKQYETRAWFCGQMLNMMKSPMGCAHPGLASMVDKYKLHLNP
jgi:heme-degrading monooxygenase HmoA